ncbi:MAG: cation:proton antiporter [Egibacteraceae bacterium]
MDVVAQPNLTSQQVVAFVLFNIAVILIMARLCGAVAKRLGQPAVVGEIIAGVLLGPTLLGPAIFSWDVPWAFLDCEAALGAGGEPSLTSCLFPPQSRAVLGLLGQLALLLFMFLVGLEFDFDLLKGKMTSILLVGVGVVAVPVALGFALNPVLYNETFVANFGGADEPSRLAFALLVGAMLSVTAFPVMARILQEKGLTLSPMGAVGVAAAAVVTILMFVLVSVAGDVAAGVSLPDAALPLSAPLAPAAGRSGSGWACPPPTWWSWRWWCARCWSRWASATRRGCASSAARSTRPAGPPATSSPPPASAGP